MQLGAGQGYTARASMSGRSSRVGAARESRLSREGGELCTLFFKLLNFLNFLFEREEAAPLQCLHTAVQPSVASMDPGHL